MSSLRKEKKGDEIIILNEEDKQDKKEEKRTDCPYLDTITRTILDFDFEKQCSVTLQNINVYACLVCGKYFQGRGKRSPAFIHSIQLDHHVFINLHSTKVYCLPDDYEVIDSSLHDIKYALDPIYNKEEIKLLDKNTELVRTIDGGEYLPGIVGLNDIKLNTSINAVLQSLMRVSLLRNYFIVPKNYSHLEENILETFGQLIRRVWSKGLYRSQISPHEILQSISNESKKHFRSGQSSEPVEFLSWLLNTFHRKLSSKSSSSIIHKCFQGVVEVKTYNPIKKRKDEMSISEEAEIEGYDSPQISSSPFLYLSLDVPPPPLFKSELEKNIIPQVSIYQLLDKFNGVTAQHITKTGQKRRFKITSPPEYLILHIKRFTRNNYFIEKNRTIVNFPIKDLDISDYCKLEEGSKISTKYNLIANIRHRGEREDDLDKSLATIGEVIKGTYTVDIQNKGDERWFEVQDLMVKETMPQLIALSEAYIQIYERVHS